VALAPGNGVRPGPCRSYCRTVDVTDLEAEVASAFRVTGASTPGWPDPHEDDPTPGEEEYSRCLDPYKYRIVCARADAWVVALTRLGLAHARAVPVTGLWRDEPDRLLPDRAVLLEPVQPGALPLVLAHRNGSEGRAASVQVGAGHPAVLVGSSPDCGCDACDLGSAHHLEELDAAVLPVVTGELVHVRAPRVTVMSTGTGWQVSGSLRRVDAERMLEKARAGRSRHRVVRGDRWW
jgi:Family of unknown function (DUF6226)